MKLKKIAKQLGKKVSDLTRDDIRRAASNGLISAKQCESILKKMAQKMDAIDEVAKRIWSHDEGSLGW